MSPYFLLLAVLAGSYSALAKRETEVKWQSYKMIFNKLHLEEESSYDAQERALLTIEKQNIEVDTRLYSHNRDINLDTRGFLGSTSCYQRRVSTSYLSTFLPPSNIELPDEVDWRTKGFVSKVKDQGYCGASWAFSTTGALEGQQKRKTGYLIELSEQNLVDCSIPQGNCGCKYGNPESAFNYVIQNSGIDTETSYPYLGKNGTCRFNRGIIGATCTGIVNIQSGDENMLMTAVATVGPISASIDARHISFKKYRGGIYDEPSCDSRKLNHAVLIVGYGTESGKDYWIVKNCWGTKWGEQGYILMSRNKNNQCGIATKAMYPLV